MIMSPQGKIRFVSENKTMSISKKMKLFILEN